MNAVEEDVVDAREVDKVLSEVAGMAGRWSLFRKFLYERLQVRDPHFGLASPTNGCHRMSQSPTTRLQRYKIRHKTLHKLQSR